MSLNSNNQPFPKGKAVQFTNGVVAKVEIEAPNVIRYGRNGALTSAAVVIKNGALTWWDIRAEITH